MAFRSDEWVPALFAAWEKAGIRYAVLRNYASLPEDTGNDLDLLVDPKQLRDAERILFRVMRDCGGAMHNRAEFSPVSLFFCDPRDGTQFHVDLFRDLKWRGFRLLRTEDVLSRVRRYNNMWVISLPDEAVLNLLTRLVFGGYVKDKYKPSIRQVFEASAEQSLSILAAATNGTLARQLHDWVLAENWTAIEDATPTVRKAVFRNALRTPFDTTGSLLYDARRLLARWVHTPGLAIVLAGPDGCGKTSVGVELTKRLAGTFYEEYTTHVHWKPRLLKSMADAANPFGTPRTDPHAKPVRGPLMNIAYFTAHSLEIPPAWLLRVRPRLFRNKMVIIDRYYYDFMVDPRRFRIRVSDRWAWLMYRFMPKPGLVIGLTAPVDVIQSRKREVPPEETARQCVAYQKVIDHLPYGYMVDTNRPLEAVVDEALGIVLNHLVQRAKKRT